MSDTSQQKRPIFDVPEQGIAIQRITPVEQDLACSVPTKERSEMRKGEGIVAGVMRSGEPSGISGIVDNFVAARFLQAQQGSTGFNRTPVSH